MLNILNKDYNLKDLSGTKSSKEVLKVLENYELKHNYYTMTMTEEVEAESEVEIPCNYIVGNDDIDIFIDGIYLKCEKSEDDIGNYREIGEIGTVSNKIQFGFNLEVGEELTIIRKGAVEEDEQN